MYGVGTALGPARPAGAGRRPARLHPAARRPRPDRPRRRAGAVALDRARRPARRRDGRSGRVLPLGEHGVRQALAWVGLRRPQVGSPGAAGTRATGEQSEMSMTPGGPADGPEYLDGSGPAQPAPDNDNKKRLIAVGAIVAGGAVVAGGAWAATSFFSTGAQPAEALPASTVAYFSVDLDPSGGQKIEAIKTLRKFPGFTDKVDLETDDDLRERLLRGGHLLRRVRGPRLRRRRQAVAGLARGDGRRRPRRGRADPGRGRAGHRLRQGRGRPVHAGRRVRGRSRAPRATSAAGWSTATGSSWRRPRRSPRRSSTRPTARRSRATPPSRSGPVRRATTASCRCTSARVSPSTSTSCGGMGGMGMMGMPGAAMGDRTASRRRDRTRRRSPRSSSG